MKSHKKIIDLLSEHKQLTVKELELLTGYTYNGLRGRISEIRKLGYNIEQRIEPTKKYVFLGKTEEHKINADKILLWLKETYNFDKDLKYSTIATAIQLPQHDTNDAMITLQKRGLLLQTSNTSGIIRKPKYQ